MPSAGGICDHGHAMDQADQADQTEALAGLLILLVMSGGVAGLAGALLKALTAIQAPPGAIAAIGQTLVESTRPDDQVLGATLAP